MCGVFLDITIQDHLPSKLPGVRNKYIDKLPHVFWKLWDIKAFKLPIGKSAGVKIVRLAAPWSSFEKCKKKPFFAVRQSLEILWLAHISRVLSCQSSRPEDSKNVVELIGEAFSRNAFQMEGELNSELADVIIERRAHFKQAYIQLRQAHPALPAQLRHFQV